MPRILVAPVVLSKDSGPYRDVLEKAGFELVYPPTHPPVLDKPTLIQQLQGIDATLASIEPYDDEVFAASKLRAVARVGVGYDSIDVPSATRHGVAVTTTPGTNEHAVAEHAIAMMFAVFRDIPVRHAEVHRGIWRKDVVRRLSGNTLGLVGLGRIGKAVVPRAQALGLRVVAHDPYPDRQFAKEHKVELLALDELLGQSDIVSLHLPWTKETADVINERTLRQMKPGAVLINTSRGGLVDELALADALRDGHLSAAGLDVFKIEPVPNDNPLLKMDNVVITPHLGGLDKEALDAMGKLAAECLVGLYHGKCPEGCLLNPQIMPGWKW